MNCPTCTNVMVLTRATHTGDDYHYCRTCKKELAEIQKEVLAQVASIPPTIPLLSPGVAAPRCRGTMHFFDGKSVCQCRQDVARGVCGTTGHLWKFNKDECERCGTSGLQSAGPQKNLADSLQHALDKFRLTFGQEPSKLVIADQYWRLLLADLGLEFNIKNYNGIPIAPGFLLHATPDEWLELHR